jgi:hypothetical protein
MKFLAKMQELVKEAPKGVSVVVGATFPEMSMPLGKDGHPRMGHMTASIGEHQAHALAGVVTNSDLDKSGVLDEAGKLARTMQMMANAVSKAGGPTFEA